MESTASDPSPSAGQAGPGLIESVWRYRWLVAAITILAGAAAYGLSLLQTPVYEARGRLLLTDPTASGLFEETLGAGGERFLANQVEIANSPDVHARAAELLGGDHTEGSIESSVEVIGPSEEVDVLSVVAEGESGEEAAARANAVAEAYIQLRAEEIQQRADRSIEQLGETMTRLRERIAAVDAEIGPNPAQVDPVLEAERDAAAEQLAAFEGRTDQIAVDAALFGSGVERFTEARPPSAPAQPQPLRNAAVGVVLGMLAGSGLAWFRAERARAAEGRLDPAPVLRAPLLAQIPEFKSVNVTGLDPARSAPESVAAESYQFLVSSLEFALAKIDGQSVLITSAARAAGKTLTAFNLATAAVRDGRRVVLCDGDERTRGLTSLTGTAPTPGLTDLADDEVPVEGAVALIDVPTTPGLPFVAAGSRPADPAGFFRTAGFRHAMRRIKQHGDLIIVDAPPILAVSDTSAIASQVDGIVVVVPRNTPLSMLQEARERLDFVGTPVLGYVFNRADRMRSEAYTYGRADDHGYRGNGMTHPHVRRHAAGNGARRLESTPSGSRPPDN